MGADFSEIKEPVKILLVEDNPAHAELSMRCFSDHRLPNEVHHVPDGEAALDYLNQRGEYEDPEEAPEVQLVLLDLRLPKLSGLEVLQEIKTSEKLKSLPVIMLSTSNADKDIMTAFSNGANSYVIKPIDFGDFTQLIEDLGLFWMSWNISPWSQSMKHPNNS